MDKIDRLRHEWDLADIKGPRFRRLLRLAIDEGLLSELLREPFDCAAEYSVLAEGAAGDKIEKSSLDQRHHDQQASSEHLSQ